MFLYRPARSRWTSAEFDGRSPTVHRLEGDDSQDKQVQGALHEIFGLVMTLTSVTDNSMPEEVANVARATKVTFAVEIRGKTEVWTEIAQLQDRRQTLP